MSGGGGAGTLFAACLSDLAAAERLVAERLPGIAGAATDERLRGEFARLVDEARRHRDEMEKLAEAQGEELDGPPNLWMSAVLDDADRDTRDEGPGPPLDTALLGALRKGVASQIVSYDTAVAVAGALGLDEARARLAAIAWDKRQADAKLAALLGVVAGGLG